MIDGVPATALAAGPPAASKEAVPERTGGGGGGGHQPATTQGAAFLAVVYPAWRDARVDPLVVLRAK
jgi:hypothetical protein